MQERGPRRELPLPRLPALLPLHRAGLFPAAPPGQKPLVLAASWFFYLCAKPIYLVFLLFAVCSTYVTGLVLEGRGRKKGPLALCAALNLGLLVVFKYLNFAISLAGRGLAALGLDFSARCWICCARRAVLLPVPGRGLRGGRIPGQNSRPAQLPGATPCSCPSSPPCSPAPSTGRGSGAPVRAGAPLLLRRSAGRLLRFLVGGL